MLIKDKIKNRRIELGLTMEEVAKSVGVSRPTVLRWESGYISTMKQSKIIALANVLRVDPMYLISEEDDNLGVLSNHSLLSSSVDNLSPLSLHEKKVLIAYRNNPNMQEAVDRLLNVDSPESGAVRTYRAARSTNDAPAIIEERPLSDIERLRKAKKVTSEEDL